MLFKSMTLMILVISLRYTFSCYLITMIMITHNYRGAVEILFGHCLIILYAHVVYFWHIHLDFQTAYDIGYIELFPQLVPSNVLLVSMWVSLYVCNFSMPIHNTQYSIANTQYSIVLFYCNNFLCNNPLFCVHSTCNLHN